ncbi:hypothetical protein B0H10DRAFT_2160404 [Mycena sp. CBHHK59/15]|nr:hypothetical protein B0H10DRAFT_2160404 [Mycena sp. CBHHK59/15]
MADTVIANASPEDLRAILRNMLSSRTPGMVSAFTLSTRARLYQCNLQSLPTTSGTPFAQSCDGMLKPAPPLVETLTRARLLYGSGMGFASLAPLAWIVRSTIGARWVEEGEIVNVFATVDTDIAQAIQSCTEELQETGAVDSVAARQAVGELHDALQASRADVDGWGGEFPFERAIYSVQHLRL